MKEAFGIRKFKYNTVKEIIKETGTLKGLKAQYLSCVQVMSRFSHFRLFCICKSDLDFYLQYLTQDRNTIIKK
jgi:hypothetical protein